MWLITLKPKTRRYVNFIEFRAVVRMKQMKGRIVYGTWAVMENLAKTLTK